MPNAPNMNAVGNNTSLTLNFHTCYCIPKNVIFLTISLLTEL